MVRLLVQPAFVGCRKEEQGVAWQGWLEDEEGEGYFGQQRHYCSVPPFHNDIFANHFCGMANERNPLLTMVELQISQPMESPRQE